MTEDWTSKWSNHSETDAPVGVVVCLQMSKNFNWQGTLAFDSKALDYVLDD